MDSPTDSQENFGSVDEGRNIMFYFILAMCIIACMILYKYRIVCKIATLIDNFFRGPPLRLLTATSNRKVPWTLDQNIIKWFLVDYNQESEINSKDIEGLPFEWVGDTKFVNIQKNTCVLGKGHFGEVLQGYVRKGSSEKIPVAIKIPNFDCTPENEIGEIFKEFLTEIKMHVYLGDSHNHVVGFVGANTERIKNFCVQLILEYCPGGDMRTYLKKFGTDSSKYYYFCNDKKLYQKQGQINQVVLDSKRIIIWCQQIAMAMEYISNKGLVHRDLAARNILLGYPNNVPAIDGNEDKPEKLEAKIGDFGLAREKLDGKTYYCPAKSSTMLHEIPAQSCCPEALRTKRFSSKSDVWSFGVTVWELFTLCEKEAFDEKLSHSSSEECTNIDDYLEKRGTLTPPPYAPKPLWEIIKLCLNSESENRPDFKTLNQKLKDLIESEQQTSTNFVTENEVDGQPRHKKKRVN